MPRLMVLRKKKEATVLKESLLATRRHLSCWGICLCLVTQSCPTLWDPVDCSLPGPSVHGILWARIVGNHSLLPGIFPTQEVNPGLLHCRRIIYLLSHQESPHLFPRHPLFFVHAELFSTFRAFKFKIPLSQRCCVSSMYPANSCSSLKRLAHVLPQNLI